LRKAASEGDVERTDAICTGLADEYGVKVLLRSIADLALETLTAATHTHIGLMHIARIWGEAGPVATQLARAGLRAMAQEPVARLKPVSKRRVLKDPEGDLESILSQVPAQPPSVKGIRALLEDAEKAGLIEELLGDALLSNPDPALCKAASRAACRIAALSMLGDSPEFPASFSQPSSQIHLDALPHDAAGGMDADAVCASTSIRGAGDARRRRMGDRLEILLRQRRTGAATELRVTSDRFRRGTG
jgi:hypothetical protein